MSIAVFRDRLVIVNEAAELRRMTDWLRACCARMELPAGLEQALDLCANELVANIITYAHDDAGPHDIVLEIIETDSGVRLIIDDDGRPFDPTAVALRRPPADLGEAAIGGLGLQLVRSLADCSHSRSGGRNRLCVDLPRRDHSGNA